jgi:serine/threonine protein kinase
MAAKLLKQSGKSYDRASDRQKNAFLGGRRRLPMDQHIATQDNTQDLKRTVASEAAIVIDNRYVLERRLGGGGMGVVYRARDKLMERHHDRDPYVALKLISDAMRNDAEMRTLLQRECSRAQKLSHPNIIRVFYFGCDEKIDADYLTMELLLGEPLEHLIRDNPSGIPWQRSSRLIDQLCSGLTYAHAQGIVHSDIKPSNLFMTDASMLKILDFGIAAPLRSAETRSAETQANPRHLRAVSMRYSSLEMHLGLDADPRDDVYSAACVIYELLTGRHPFGELTTPRAAEENLKPKLVASLGKVQNRALAKALNFRRSERTASIEELKNGLLAAPSPMSKVGIRYAAAALLIAAVVAVASVALRRGVPDSAENAAIPIAASPVTAPAPIATPTQVVTPSPGRSVTQVDSNAQKRQNGSAPSTQSDAPEHWTAIRTKMPPLALVIDQTFVPAGIDGKPPPLIAVQEAPVVETKPPPVVASTSPTPRLKVIPAGSAAPAAKATSPSAAKKFDKRCASIDERIQLGDSISEQERSFYAENCQ